jgi:cell division protein FtsZ
MPARPAAAAPAGQAPASVNASIESAAKAAIAAAVEDVTLRPLSPKPTLFIEPAAEESELPEPKAFIPPQAERVSPRTLRMPRIDELPVPAQNEIRARRGELPPGEHPDKRRKSLLERLASVGLGRREPDKDESMPPRTALGSPQQGERLAGRPVQRPLETRPEPVSEYARRPAPQGLDPHGRQAVPAQNSGDEDQLDIPAFLRRQAN